MLNLLSVLEFPVVEALGWALLHFIWQAVLVAGLLFLVLAQMRRAPSQARYLVLCGGFALLAVCPVVTWIWLYSATTMEPDRFVVLSDDSGLEVLTSAYYLQEPHDQSLVHQQFGPLISDFLVNDSLTTQPARMVESALFPAVESTTGSAPTDATQSGLSRLIELNLPWLISAWFLGVLLLSIRLLMGWRVVKRIQRFSTNPAPAHWQQRLTCIAARLRVTQTVRLVESTFVVVPTVIGWLRPLVLIPPSVLTGLDPIQLEALLAHEIAHIRRQDFLVNLIQTAIETLLFYHPVVWWVSHRIREEREHCCDDLAVEVCGNTLIYARALATMEELRSAPRLTIAADGGSLIGRIRRLVNPPPHIPGQPWGASLIAMTIVFLAGICAYVTSNSQAASEPPASQKDRTIEVVPNQVNQVPIESDRRVAQKSNPKSVAFAPSELTPAVIAERVRETIDRFAHVEYVAETSEVLDANGFKPQSEPLLVAGPGRIHYRSDRTRWFAEETGITVSLGQQDAVPRRVVSGFDGSTHFVLKGGRIVFGENDIANGRVAPREIFWNGAKSAGWLLIALQNFNAKIVRREMVNQRDQIVIESEPGKPKPGTEPVGGFQRHDWHYEITISPSQSWLPIKTVIHYDGKPYATETLTQLTQTESGDWYPARIDFVNHQRFDTLVRRDIRVNSLKLAPNFDESAFQLHESVSVGMDIVDRRLGKAWHNDPWWPEISQWLAKNTDWPRLDLRSLNHLQSFSDARLEGTPAPAIQASEWVAGKQFAPAIHNDRNAQSFWRWPGRRVTVLFFFGGDAIEPTPGWVSGLKSLQQRYGSLGLDVVCVTTSTIDREIIKRAVKSFDLQLPVAIDAPIDPGVKEVNPYGKTYGAFGLQAYVGAIVIDPSGRIKLIPKSASESEYSPLEDLVRKELSQIDAAALRRSDQLLLSRHLAFDLTGSPLSKVQLKEVLDDTRADWASHLARSLFAQANESQQKWFALHQLTVERIVDEVLNEPNQLSSASYYRIRDEWKRMRSERPPQLSIGLEILRTEGPRDRFVQANPAVEDVAGARVQVRALPQLRLLSSNTPGGWSVVEAHQAVVQTETNSEGRGTLSGLVKGTYEITITAPGMATVEKVVTIPTDNSKIGLGITIHQGDTITGTVTDSQHQALVDVTITPKLRHPFPDRPRITTTEHLPSKAVATDANGQFIFDKLYDGAYTFEVSADGYTTQLVERIPAGKAAVPIVLLKAGETPVLNAPVRQKARVVLRGGKKQIPLAGLKVKVRRDLDQKAAIIAQSTTEPVTEVETNAEGIAEFEAHPGRLLLDVSSTREYPYLKLRGSREMILTAKAQGQGPATLNLTLPDPCELTLRAVDVESGKGISGVKFGTENAAGEYWLQVVIPENIGANRPLHYFQPGDPKVPNEKDYESDAEGNYRVLMGPRSGWKYMLYTVPAGYEAVQPGLEVEIETPHGGRASYTFKLRKKKSEVRTEGADPQSNRDVTDRRDRTDDRNDETSESNHLKLPDPMVSETAKPDSRLAAGALEKGIAFLRSEQRDDGSWPDHDGFPGSVTAMVTASLLQAGVKPSDPAIQKALPVLRRNPLKNIYVVALETIVFSAASPQDDAALIRQHVAWIEKAQATEGPAVGGWSYLEGPTLRADGSCSRFAVLGLHAAQKAGFKVDPETWRRVSQYWLTSQTAAGKWSYTMGAQPTTTMTLAGIACLAIANEFLPIDDATEIRKTAIQRATASVKPEINGVSRSGFPFYGLHCLERAGRLSNTDRFGELDWKTEIVKQLQAGQQANGAWTAGRGAENQYVATSFALMILGQL